MGNITAKSFLEIDTNKLRAAGLSRPKISYLQGIANEEINGNLNYSIIPTMTDEEARDFLCKFKASESGQQIATLWPLYLDLIFGLRTILVCKKV